MLVDNLSRPVQSVMLSVVWSLVVLKDKISVFGLVLGLEGQVLVRDYTFNVFMDTYIDLITKFLCNLKRFAAACLPVCLIIITIIIYLTL